MPSVDIIIPPIIHADRESPFYWQPPKGARLVVMLDGKRLRDVVEVDVHGGTVRTLHVLELGGGKRQEIRDDDGSVIFREYRGKVTLALGSSDDLLGYKPIGRKEMDARRP